MMKTNFFLKFIQAALLSLCFLFSVQVGAQEIVSMKKHVEAGVACESCHKDGNTKADPSASCIACHATKGEDYYYGEQDAKGNSVTKEYIESKKPRMAAFHDSHGGKIRCTVCHTSHKEPEQLYCNNCHQFEVQIK